MNQSNLELLRLLYQTAQRTDDLDAVMLADRMECGFYSTQFTQLISVFRIPVLDWSTYLRKNTVRLSDLTPEPCTIAFRACMVAFVVLVPVPYALYITWVPNLLSANTSNTFFLLFMTIVNITPLITILFYLRLVYLRNKITYLRLWLFRKSVYYCEKQVVVMAHQKPPPLLQQQEKEQGEKEVEEPEQKEEECPDQDTELAFDLELSAHPGAQEMLKSLSQEIQCLEMLGTENIRMRQARHRESWSTYMRLIVLWIGCLCVLYVLWDSLYVFSGTCGLHNPNQSVCFVFSIVLITSPFRFAIPVVIISKFAIDCAVLIDRIDQFVKIHMENNFANSSNRIPERCEQWESVVRLLERTASWWSGVFLACIAMPLMGVVVMVGAVLINGEVLTNEWFFLMYCVHYSLLSLITFHRAAGVSSASASMETTLRKARLKQKLFFDTNTGETAIKEYFWFLANTYSGFTVFGFTVTQSLLNQLRLVITVIITFLSEHVAH